MHILIYREIYLYFNVYYNFFQVVKIFLKNYYSHKYFQYFQYIGLEFFVLLFYI